MCVRNKHKSKFVQNTVLICLFKGSMPNNASGFDEQLHIYMYVNSFKLIQANSGAKPWPSYRLRRVDFAKQQKRRFQSEMDKSFNRFDVWTALCISVCTCMQVHVNMSLLQIYELAIEWQQEACLFLFFCCLLYYLIYSLYKDALCVICMQ